MINNNNLFTSELYEFNIHLDALLTQSVPFEGIVDDDFEDIKQERQEEVTYNPTLSVNTLSDSYKTVFARSLSQFNERAHHVYSPTVVTHFKDMNIFWMNENRECRGFISNNENEFLSHLDIIIFNNANEVRKLKLSLFFHFNAHTTFSELPKVSVILADKARPVDEVFVPAGSEMKLQLICHNYHRVINENSPLIKFDLECQDEKIKFDFKVKRREDFESQFSHTYAYVDSLQLIRQYIDRLPPVGRI